MIDEFCRIGMVEMFLYFGEIGFTPSSDLMQVSHHAWGLSNIVVMQNHFVESCRMILFL